MDLRLQNRGEGGGFSVFCSYLQYALEVISLKYFFNFYLLQTLILFLDRKVLQRNEIYTGDLTNSVVNNLFIENFHSLSSKCSYHAVQFNYQTNFNLLYVQLLPYVYIQLFILGCFIGFCAWVVAGKNRMMTRIIG